ncbi:MAG: HNH endonuclease [Methylocystis sp.]
MSDSSGNGRPPIPTEIRRRVLVEAGHRCAIPTCRYIEVDVHHIIPWAQRQAHEYDNLIALCPNCHRRADRGEIDRKSLRLYKLNLRFTHDKFSQTEVDVLFETYNANPQGIMWPPFMHILLRRLIESGYIQIHQQSGMVIISGMRASPDIITITAKGIEFIKELGAHEL